MFKFAMFYRLDNFDSTIFLYNFKYKVFVIKWFTAELVHEPKLDICHL
jgi:hypothetical protein